MDRSATLPLPASVEELSTTCEKPVDKLWRTYFESRSAQSLNNLIVHYLPLVKFAAGRIFHHRNGQIDRDDLIQCGTLGLRDAVGRFDPARGIKFETYCARRIHGAMLDGLKTNRWVPRDLKRQITTLADTRQRLETQLGHTPDSAILADQLGMTEDELFTMERHEARAGICSLDNSVDGDANVSSHADALVDQRECQPIDESHRRDLRDLLLKSLSKTERLIMILYYYENMKMREIGETIGISGTRVCQIHSEVVALLRHRLAHTSSPESKALTIDV